MSANGFYDLTPIYPPSFVGRNLSFVTGFTHRTNITYLELLMELYKWLRDKHIPELDSILEKFKEQYELDFKTLKDDITSTKNDWENLFNLFMADVVNQIKILNDKAVSELMDDEISETGITLRKIIGEFTNSIVTKASDSTAYLDNIKLLAKFPVRESGELLWLQGVSLNPDADEYYTSNQKDNQLRIDVRKLSTNERKYSRYITTEDFAFTESLEWFYSNGDLCFIVWPKAMSFPGAYAIYNAETRMLSAQIPINGLVRGSRQGDVFVTGDVWATNPLRRLYFYSWQSIINGSPKLLREVWTENRGGVANKNQGIAYVGNTVFFGQGSQTQDPTICGYDVDGTISTIRTWSRQNFAKALNNLDPGAVTNTEYLYEAEGTTSLNGKLVTVHIVNNNPSVTADAIAYVVQHNNIDGEHLGSATTSLVNKTKWYDLILEPGWVHSTGGRLQARVNNGGVEFRGFATNPDFVTPTTTMVKIATLPPEIPAPIDYGSVGAVGGNTESIRCANVRNNRTIEAYCNRPTSSWFGLQGCNYGL